MDFNPAADHYSTELSRPDRPAQEEEKKIPDVDVRNFETRPEYESSPTDSKGDTNFSTAKEGEVENLLDLDPYGHKKSSEPEQSAPATNDSGPTASQPGPRNDSPTEHVTGQEAALFELEEKDKKEVGGSDLASYHISSDSPVHTSIPLSEQENPIPSKSADTFVPESAGDVAPISTLSDANVDSSSKSSDKKVSHSPDNLLDFDTTGLDSAHADPAFDSYLDEPTPKSDASFKMPSAAATTAELSDGSLNPMVTDSDVERPDQSDTDQRVDSISPVQDPPVPEPTPTFPRSDSPILLETATKPDESAINPSATSDVSAEAPVPYINPDPFQDYIPPVEEKELGDHKPARIPSPSSMDVEPPTPVDRSSLSSLKETEEVEPTVDAEGAVDKLPLETLRHRDVQEALSAVIPPAPDKPLPPTPGTERHAAPAGCLLGLGQLPGESSGIRSAAAGNAQRGFLSATGCRLGLCVCSQAAELWVWGNGVPGNVLPGNGVRTVGVGPWG